MYTPDRSGAWAHVHSRATLDSSRTQTRTMESVRQHPGDGRRVGVPRPHPLHAHASSGRPHGRRPDSWGPRDKRAMTSPPGEQTPTLPTTCHKKMLLPLQGLLDQDKRQTRDRRSLPRGEQDTRKPSSRLRPAQVNQSPLEPKGRGKSRSAAAARLVSLRPEGLTISRAERLTRLQEDDSSVPLAFGVSESAPSSPTLRSYFSRTSGEKFGALTRFTSSGDPFEFMYSSMLSPNSGKSICSDRFVECTRWGQREVPTLVIARQRGDLRLASHAPGGEP